MTGWCSQAATCTSSITITVCKVHLMYILYVSCQYACVLPDKLLLRAVGSIWPEGLRTMWRGGLGERFCFFHLDDSLIPPARIFNWRRQRWSLTEACPETLYRWAPTQFCWCTIPPLILLGNGLLWSSLVGSTWWNPFCFKKNLTLGLRCFVYLKW